MIDRDSNIQSNSYRSITYFQYFSMYIVGILFSTNKIEIGKKEAVSYCQSNAVIPEIITALEQ